MTFVFCSLLELAWVGYLSRDDSPPKPKPLAPAPSAALPSTPVKLVQHPVHVHEIPQAPQTLHRRTVPNMKSEDENAALLMPRDNDYGYIPPGYGLNGNIKSAMSMIAGPCACHKTNQYYNNDHTYIDACETCSASCPCT